MRGSAGKYPRECGIIKGAIMKLKESTIRDFAQALGDDTIDDVEIGEARIEHYHKAIPKVSVRNNLKEIFLPILELKEALLEALDIPKCI